jgi:hypothetical protein
MRLSISMYTLERTVGRVSVAKSCTSQLLNEIMPMIYKRFTEKAAEEWRQIYKVAFPSPHEHGRELTEVAGPPTLGISHQKRQ